uniref:[histone H3]-dimethyl-L-lysine(36) demethylase n=1 Tax=Tetraodon nigroviridis TaxID=99883 RepID=H3CC49_TETNG
RRHYHDDGISDEEIDGRRTFNLEEKVNSQRFSSELVNHMEGIRLCSEIEQYQMLREKTVCKNTCFSRMPDPDFTVNDVKMFVGSRRMIDVMDVSTQKGTEMSMAQWTRYYETPLSQREKLYNVISLEFSHTKLENLVRRPTTVDLIDWVDNMWPRHLKERQRDSTNSITDMQYPKVQKYCLMSVEGCYTDFHIDFGGTSVWYHILRGSKVFWLIPPTPQNLELYENWVLSGKQGDVFLGDRASDCQRIELKQGYTFIIPSGWIHAVYTPVDSMVFGGNFLHSFNIPTQLNICNIEDRTRVPTKFRYPFYYEMCWYVLERYVFSLTKTSYLTPEFQRHSLGIVGNVSSISVLGLKKPCKLANEKGILEDEESSEDEVQREHSDEAAAKIHLTPLELEGLWNLLGKLEDLPPNKKCIPSGIHNFQALVAHIKALLKEHANDNPKLSYTGKPIITWPKRPPPPPPPPPPRPKLATISIIPRPQKPASSMSVLRRRRVRCKRCEACVRSECGDCNFCRDMKKFGGPGKLKQTCVLRQCLSPGLPLSAVCEVCKEPNQDETGDTSLTLMECSNCAQIVHPACLTIQGEGLINKDLPSCWECPRCVQGVTDPEPSLLFSSKFLPSVVKRFPVRRGVSAGGGGCTGLGACAPLTRISRLFLRSMSIYALRRCSDGLSIRKRGFVLINRFSLPPAIEGRQSHASFQKRKSSTLLDARMAKIYRQQRHSRDEDDSGSDDEDAGLLWLFRKEAGKAWKSEEGGSRGALMGHGSFRLKRGMAMRESGRRGRGVRLRGGSRDSEDGGKERHRRRRRRRTDDQEPPVLLMSDLNDDLLSGSYLTVTLQRPDKAKKQTGKSVKARRTALSKHIPARLGDGPNDWATPRGPGSLSRPRGCHGDRGRKDFSALSSEEEHTVAPSLSLLSLPSFKDVGNDSGGEKEVWVSVFTYLNRAELLACMTVCKAWYKWSCDKRLWSHIDVSRCSPLSNQALAGIIKRQPYSLDLSWTPLAKRQLNCLLTRLPGLRELRVAGLAWSCLSALVSPTLPCLQLLDLRWCEGIKDAQIKDLIIPPASMVAGSESSRSRLRNLVTLRLSGLDISESILKLLQRHMTQLERLELSHCKNITDSSVALLAAPGTHTRNNLTELTLAGCNELTDCCLLYMKRLSSLTLLDLRGCKSVSRRACDAFIADLSHISLYCMMEEKLIQRID